MKTLLIAYLLLGSVAAFADHHEEWDKLPFPEKKAKVSEKLDMKIKKLQEHKTCVDSAADEAALKTCKEKMKKDMKEHHKEMKDKMNKMKGKKK